MNTDRESRLVDHSGRVIPKPKTFSDRLLVLFNISKKAWLSVAAFVAFAGTLVANYEKISKYIVPERVSSAPASVASNQKLESTTAKESGSNQPAPIVTFTDGSRAFVGFSLLTTVIPEDAPLLVVKYGTREAALKVLAPQVEAELLTMLEALTQPETRQRRSAITSELVSKMKPIFKEGGVTLDSVIIREIHSF